MKYDAFGDRMKAHESRCGKFVEFGEGDEDIFLYLRLDGRSFSKFTNLLARARDIVKPRDETFEHVFIKATQDTVEEFSLALGFHQSDEISLFFKPVHQGGTTELLFGGNVQKIVSVVASYYTNRFIYHFNEVYGWVPDVSFDCRHVAFADGGEAVNMLVWRWQDATRNVIQDYAFHMFGHKALDKISTREKLAKILSVKPDFEETVLKHYGNFIKRELYDKFVSGNVNEEDTFVTRSRITQIHNVEFKSLTFDQRVELVYGVIDSRQYSK